MNFMDKFASSFLFFGKLQKKIVKRGEVRTKKAFDDFEFKFPYLRDMDVSILTESVVSLRK